MLRDPRAFIAALALVLGALPSWSAQDDESQGASDREAAARELLDSYSDVSFMGYAELFGMGLAYRHLNLHRQAMQAFRYARDATDMPDKAREAAAGVALALHDMGEVCAAAAEFEQLASEFPESTSNNDEAYKARFAATGHTPEVVRLNCQLREAIRKEDIEAVAGLIARGADVDVRDVNGSTLLHAAAWHKAADVAALLVRHGAAIVEDDAGWTPLHHVLTLGVDDDAEEPRAEIVRLLLDAGTDANAATDVVGWTPLHLAAGVGDPVLVRELLARDAKPNVRTRVGGWTPLYIAERPLEHGWTGWYGPPVERGAPEHAAQRKLAEETAEALRAAGAESLSDADGVLTVFQMEGGGNWRNLAKNGRTPLALPRFDAGGSAVSGSFTAAGADERLVFDTVGFNIVEPESLTATALADRQGKKHMFWVADSMVKFLGLCRDGETGLDNAMFEFRNLGSCCGPELQFWHFDAQRGNLVRGYAFERPDSEPLNDWGWLAWAVPGVECRWRERKAAEAALAEALSALALGDAARPDRDTLATRVIPTATVEASLAVLRTLPPDIATMHEGFTYIDGPDDAVPITSERWEVVGVESGGRGADGRIGTDSVVLVHDKRSGEWRSIYQGKFWIGPLRDNQLEIGGDHSPMTIDLESFSVGY